MLLVVFLWLSATLALPAPRDQVPLAVSTTPSLPPYMFSLDTYESRDARETHGLWKGYRELIQRLHEATQYMDTQYSDIAYYRSRRRPYDATSALSTVNDFVRDITTLLDSWEPEVHSSGFERSTVCLAAEEAMKHMSVLVRAISRSVDSPDIVYRKLYDNLADRSHRLLQVAAAKPLSRLEAPIQSVLLLLD